MGTGTVKGSERATSEPVRTAHAGDRVVTLLPRSPYDVAYVPDTGVVGFAFESQRGEHAFAGDRSCPFQAWPDTLSWVPPGCEVRSRSPGGGEYLAVRLAPGEASPAWRERRFNDHRDERARRAAHALRAGLLRGDDAAGLGEHVDALLDRVSPALERRPDERPAATWLNAARLGRIDEWIEAHLAERAGVAALANELGVSAGFLSRAMKAATGRSPHAYLIERRLARARELLRACPARSVLDIALDCGFASHSHLSATLRRRLDITPSTLRASIRAGRGR